ncbi:MAG TPA: hypothetical protein VGE24_07540 [Emticicia sp.]
MENFDENLENEYRRRFENFDEMPDDALWASIQARIQPEKERPFVVWWTQMRGPIGMAAAVLLGLLIGVYFFIKSDDTQQLGDLPAKPDTSISQPKKPDVTQKDNTTTANTEEDKKASIAAGNKTVNPGSQTLASTKDNQNKKGTRVGSESNLRNTLAPVRNNEAIAQTPVEKKAIEKEENKPVIAANPTVSEPKTEIPVVAENKQAEEEKAILAQNAEKKAIAEEKGNETKLAVNPTPEQPEATVLAHEDNQGFGVKDTLFQSIHINTLNGKEAQQMAVTGKKLEAPALPEPEMPMMIEEEGRRLRFIPPTEVFANVTSTLSYYMFSPNKGDNIMVNNFSSSSQRLGFAGQLGFVYPIARKMDLRTGLSFFSGKSRISYGVTDDAQKSVTVVNDNSVQINPGKSTQNENRNWQYFELQSDVLYETRKMQAISLGMKFGIQTSAMNKPLLQARVGYRVSKAIADHWALWLEPTISVSLSSHHALGDLFMYRTTGLGLNMGVSLLR